MRLITTFNILYSGAVLALLWSLPTSVVAQEAAVTQDDTQSQTASPQDKNSREESLQAPPKQDEDSDDTPDVDAESTIDRGEERRGLKIDGDLRPIYDYLDRSGRDGVSQSRQFLGFRARIGADWGITQRLHFGTRLAGSCFTDACDGEFILQRASFNGLAGGQFTLDQLYLHWSRREKSNIAVGRLQTRFTLRGGVYAKSLDRNDSNNVNVTWTDGLHAAYHARNGWSSHIVLQRNSRDGSGSIRRGPLDFDNSRARNTFFVGFENIQSWGPVVQRAFDVSYLPRSLLKDGDLEGRRRDYWGLVGRLAMRWPQRTEGLRLRAGTEVGYAPETPTGAAVDLDNSGDVTGLAWDVVVSAMDFVPDHSIGLNYGRTGAGWLLSPQFRQNEELFEIRYQWRPKQFPLVEARVRWREELEQQMDAVQKRNVFDLYFRITWTFTLKDY